MGARNLILSSGLGGMKPNIVVLSSFDLAAHLRRKSNGEPADFSSSEASYSARQAEDKTSIHLLINMIDSLPTDEMKKESPIDILDYMGIIEDTLMLNKAVAIGHGFEDFSPQMQFRKDQAGDKKRYIDLWPIQMTLPNGSANFNTYTMVLQMGCVLHMARQWKQNYDLRVNVFVEKESEAAGEEARVQALLDVLRIRAELAVHFLEGDVDIAEEVAAVLRELEDTHHESITEATSGNLTGAVPESQESGVLSPQAFAELSSSAAGTRQPDGDPPLSHPTVSARFGALAAPQSTGSAASSVDLGHRWSSSSSSRSQPQQSGIAFPRHSLGPSVIPTHMRINVPLQVPSELLDLEVDSDDSADDFEQFVDATFTEEQITSLPEAPPSSPPAPSASRGQSVPTIVPPGSPSRSSNPRKPAVLAESLSRPPPSSAASWKSTAAGGPVDFNSLPSTAQHRIINKLIRKHSSARNGTAIVLTSLPAPEPEASSNVAKAEKWLCDLHELIGGLEPEGIPVLAVHGVYMTVTSNL